MAEPAAPVALSEADLISNEPLRASVSGRILDSDDRFKHRRVAKRVAQLIDTPGKNVNIAVNAPWGAGKSTFFELLKEELGERRGAKPKKPRYTVVNFDAWQMADETFESNFLVTVAKDIPGSPRNIEQRLFRANRTVNLPLGLDIHIRWLQITLNVVIAAIIAALVFGIPLIQALSDPSLAKATADTWWGAFLGVYIPKLITWLTAAAGGTLAVVILGAATKLWNVSVQESGPAHVAQFRKLFAEIMKRATTTQVILVDELDRCSPEAVMRTLEGLRRFLGTDKCVFVVAFDRESVSESVTSILARSVPHREGRPYYSTAGEYLDKIFTYQVALPPQPRKAFRRYARDLVAQRDGGGVWGELKSHSQEHLDTVISILSPPHLTSPRRTKVILNDFAFNARLVESFHGEWVKRAEEIAVLTVLQTEFPLFYADLEYTPNLLMHVALQARQEPGETLKPLVKKYREGDAALDGVLSKDAVVATNKALQAQLVRFLEKLRDMRVRLPEADLIQLGTSNTMLQFDDPGVFATVEAASEVPRDETLTALEAVSAGDRYKAVELILDDSEGESTAEAMTLRILAGTLLPTLTQDERTRLLPKAQGAWDRLSSGRTDILTPAAVEGYLGCLVPVNTALATRIMLDRIARSSELVPAAAAAIAEHATEAAFPDVQEDLLSVSVKLLPTDFHPLLSTFRRMETSGTSVPTGSIARALSQSMALSDIDPDDASVEQIKTAVEVLRDFVAELPPRSQLRAWIVQIFTARAVVNASLDDLLSIIDAGSTHRDHARVALNEVLAALPHMQPELQVTLATRIDPHVAPSQKLIGPALHALTRVVANDVGLEHEEVLRAVVSLVTRATSKAELSKVDFLGDLEVNYRGVTRGDRNRYDQIRRMAHALASAPGLEKVGAELTTILVVDTVFAAPDTAPLGYVLQGIHKARVATLERIVEELTQLLPDAAANQLWTIRAILAAQIRLRELGHPAPAISAQDIQPHFAQSTELSTMEAWIQTIPPAADILSALGGSQLSKVSKKTWKHYARRGTLDDVTALWLGGLAADVHESILRAIASRGVTEEALGSRVRAMTAASNTKQRVEALRVFQTLPHTLEIGRALVSPLMLWLRHPRHAETGLVTTALVDFYDAFGEDELAQLEDAISEWCRKTSRTLTRRSRQELRAAGYTYVPSKRA